MTWTNAPFPLEPLGVGESLDAGFRLWRRHFLTFFLLSLLAVAPAQLLNAWYYTSNVLAVNEFGEILVADPDGFLIGGMVISLVGLLLQAIGWGALMNYGVRAYIGRQNSVGDAARGALRRLLPFVGLSILYFLLVGVGTVLLVVLGIWLGLGVATVFLAFPGVWLAIKLILSFPAFFGEGLGAGQSISRSIVLTAGRWWRIFALFTVAGLFSTIVTSVASSVLLTIDLTSANIVSYFYLSSAIGTLLGALFTPLIPCMMIVAYYDGRVRKEGFDIEYISGQLDPAQPWDAQAWDAGDEDNGLIR